MRGSELKRLRRLEWMRKLDRPLGTMWVWDERGGCPQLVWQEAVRGAPSSAVSSPGPLVRHMARDMRRIQAGLPNMPDVPLSG